MPFRAHQAIDERGSDTNLEVVQAEQIKIILAPPGLRCVAFGNVLRPGKK